MVVYKAGLVALGEFDAGLGKTKAAICYLHDSRWRNVLEPESAVVLRALGESLR